MVTVEAPGWVTHPLVAAGRGRLRFGVQLWRQPAEWPVLLDTVQLVDRLHASPLRVGAEDLGDDLRLSLIHLEAGRRAPIVSRLLTKSLSRP